MQIVWTYGLSYRSMSRPRPVKKSRSANSVLQRERDAKCAATCGAGQRNRAGRKFARVWPDTRDCRRDIARYMPTRSGSARRAEDAAQSRRATERAAHRRGRDALCTAKEREKGTGGREEIKKRREDIASIFFFLLPRLSCMRLDCPSLPRRSRESSCNADN